MRVVIFAMVGLTIGLGAGGGIGGLRTKGQILEVRADSLEQALADSALAATHAADEEPEGDGHEALPEDAVSHASQDHDPDEEAEAHDVDLEPYAAEPVQTEVPIKDPTDVPSKDPTEVPTKEPSEEGLERLGKIFMAMKPRDAAAVLTYLNDAEVEAILFQLREKNAAEILGSFPPDRAAVLSRSVLEKSGGVE